MKEQEEKAEGKTEKQGGHKVGEKKEKFYSIQRKIVTRNTRYMLGLSITMLFLIVSTATVLTQDALNLSLKQVAVNGAANFSDQIYVYTLCMNGISDSPYFADPALYRQQVVERLQLKTETYWAFTSYIDLDGNDYMTGENHSGKDFFTRPLQSEETFVSSPQVTSNGTYVIFSTVARYNGEVVGVFYMMSDFDYLYSLLNETSVGETGKTYVISTDDQVIFDDEIETGVQVLASQHLNKSETQQKLEAKARAGEEDGIGFGNIQDPSGLRVAGYAPVHGTDDWVLITTVESFEFLKNFNVVMAFAVFVSVSLMILCVFLNMRSTKSFTIPIVQCVERITSLAEGDLYSPVPVIHTNDEAGLLAKSMEAITDSLKKVIHDEEIYLDSLAKGDFTIKSKHPEAYVGDFAPLLISLRSIKTHLNQTLLEISQSSIEVNSAADVVSLAASNLAEGTAKQEASAQDLVRSFATISEEVENSSKRAIEISGGVTRTSEEVRTGSMQLDELVVAMEEIADSASKIENIIHGIEDIAFQTNILALNASVEAARAGTAGRGFAVVADEVRKLSIRSESHVEETGGLVETTIKAIERGTEIVRKTAVNMKNIVSEIENAMEGTQEISHAMERQAEAIEKISKSLDEISVVIATTSATSVESASTSEQLSAFASSLREMVSEFKLNKRV